MQVEHEIARLDIIAAQAANCTSAFKNAFNCIQSRKAKRLEQFEIIVTIKNNNIQTAATIAKKHMELDCLYLNPNDLPNKNLDATKKGGPSQQASRHLVIPICSLSSEA